MRLRSQQHPGIGIIVETRSNLAVDQLSQFTRSDIVFHMDGKVGQLTLTPPRHRDLAAVGIELREGSGEVTGTIRDSGHTPL
jgi:hypothetical protein